MSQKRVHENHEMSQALYEDLAALKIRIAFAEISEAELDDYDRELSSVSESDYSEAAQKRALKLIERKLNKQLSKRFISKTLPHTIQVVAITLLLFFIGLTTAVATVRPIRLRLMDFIAHIEENYSSVGIDYNDNDAIAVPDEWRGEYYLSYIPEGFAIERIGDLFNYVRYTDGKNRTIEFYELGIDDYFNFDFESENTFDVNIDGHPCIARVSDDSVFVSWGIGDTYFSLYYTGSFDEAKRMVESIKRIDLNQFFKQ